MVSSTTMDVAPAASAQLGPLSSALAQAFHTDPVLSWIAPDPDRRQTQLTAVFAAFAELYRPYGETYAIGEGAGGALCLPAGGEPFTEEQNESLAERLHLALGDDAVRAAQLDALFEEHHPAEPCYYVQFMGVRPEHQGRGLGGRLLATLLRGCDAAGTPAYLEATSPDNRRLYQRHGFEVLGALSLADGPTVWRMWREPLLREG